MLGQTIELTNDLWLIVGDLRLDIPNSILYQKSNRLYLIDSGAGPVVRASIVQLLQRMTPIQSFSLLNSHGHADHIGNNDLIQVAEANEKHHYMSERALAMLDSVPYFAEQFYTLSEIYDPTSGYRVHRIRWRFLAMLRDILALFVGKRRALEAIFSIYLRKFQPLCPSRETVQTYESLSSSLLTVGGVSWKGWILGEDDVWILESRGPTPDQVLFYFPCSQVLCTGDLTFPLFPTFPDSDAKVIREVLRRCEAMVSSGKVTILIDGHHHQIYRGKEQAAKFLETLLTEEEHFQAVLREIVEDNNGLTVGQIYGHIRQRKDDAVLQHYLSIEYPHLPMSLQQIIVVSLVQMGYEPKGRSGKKRFYQLARR